MSAGPDAVVVAGVTCTFGKRRALDGLSLRVPAGRVAGIVGPNGAGKTTLLDVVCGLLPPDAGSVTVLGLDVARAPRAVARKLGVVPQETALYEDVSARENLRFAAALYGVARAEARVDELLALVGLQAARRRSREPLVGRHAAAAVHRARAACTSRSCSCSTSPPSASTSRRATRSGRTSARCGRRGGRCFCPRTTSTRPRRCATAWPCCATGGSSSRTRPRRWWRRRGAASISTSAPEHVAALATALAGRPHVLRTEPSGAGGLTAYVDGACKTDELVRALMHTIPLQGFRARSPDLAEVFRALGRDK